MRSVTYSLGLTLDGYTMDAAGDFSWGAPDKEVFRLATDEVRGLAVHLMGRRLYETMRYWQTVPQEALDEDEREFAALWNPLPKVVFSRTLPEVDPPARLARGTLAEEVERLRAEPGDGDIGIGGADLAAQAADAGLVDEYRLRVHPVLVGGGTPFFAHHGRRADLELVDSRTFDSGVVHLRYRVVRS